MVLLPSAKPAVTSIGKNAYRSMYVGLRCLRAPPKLNDNFLLTLCART